MPGKIQKYELTWKSWRRSTTSSWRRPKRATRWRSAPVAATMNVSTKTWCRG